MLFAIGTISAMARLWRHGVAFSGMACLVCCSLSCAQAEWRESPQYQVSWDGEPVAGEHFLITPGDEVSFGGETLHVKKSTAGIDIRLFVSNHTKGALFIRRLGESVATNLSWRVRSVCKGNVYESAGFAGPVLGGCAARYSLLAPLPHGEEVVECGGESKLYLITASIPFDPATEDIEYSDVSIEFPLSYYALGCAKGALITVRRSMRVFFDLE